MSQVPVPVTPLGQGAAEAALEGQARLLGDPTHSSNEVKPPPAAARAGLAFSGFFARRAGFQPLQEEGSSRWGHRPGAPTEPSLGGSRAVEQAAPLQLPLSRALRPAAHTQRQRVRLRGL